MGRVSPKKRQVKIKQGQKRQQRLAVLRKKYLAASGSLEKEKLWEKVFRVAPHLTKEKFLSPTKKSS